MDLRIDHVYLVSCKYLSNILFNASPMHVFDDLLVGGQSRRGRGLGGDWFAETAPEQYQELYDVVRAAVQDRDVMGAGVAGGPARRSIGRGRVAPALPGLGGDRRRWAGGGSGGHRSRAGCAGRAPGAGRGSDLGPPGGVGGPIEGRAGPKRPRRRTGSCPMRWLWRRSPDGEQRWPTVPGPAPPCCGVCCGWGVHHISCWARVRPARCACVWPPLGIGVNSSRWISSSSSPRKAANRGWAGRHSCESGPSGAGPRGERTRRDPLEPRPVQRPPEAKGYLDTGHHLVPGYFQLR